jgi:hypothetical protein
LLWAPRIIPVKKIKYHKIKTLSASIQKFWNEECCTLAIENLDNLDEVIEFVEMMISKI